MLKRGTYRKREKNFFLKINKTIRRLDMRDSAHRNITRQKVLENPSRAHTEAHGKTDGGKIRRLDVIGGVHEDINRQR